jgi:phosphocarrier protein
MLAGMAETTKCGVNYGIELMEAAGMSMRREFAGPMVLEPLLVLGKAYHANVGLVQKGWDFLNSDLPKARNMRIILNAILLRDMETRETVVPAIIRNRKGMHARASAKFVTHYEKWRAELFGVRDEVPTIWIRREGPGECEVGANSIMGMMMLAVGPGSPIVLRYENCTRSEVEALLERVGCERPIGDDKYWGLHFREEV